MVMFFLLLLYALKTPTSLFCQFSQKTSLLIQTTWIGYEIWRWHFAMRIKSMFSTLLFHQSMKKLLLLRNFFNTNNILTTPLSSLALWLQPWHSICKIPIRTTFPMKWTCLLLKCPTRIQDNGVTKSLRPLWCVNWKKGNLCVLMCIKCRDM